MLIAQLLENPMMFVAWIIAALISLTLHEMFHAWAALIFGDSTAKSMGRLTLNPIPHVDPIGFIMILVAGFGWAKPVPVNPYNFKNPKVASAAVSLAGPGANLLLMAVAIILWKVTLPILGGANLLIGFLEIMISLNIALMIFNLIPIPPLDGSRVLFSIIPDKFNDFKYKFAQNGPWILISIIVLDSILNLGIFSAPYILI